MKKNKSREDGQILSHTMLSHECSMEGMEIFQLEHKSICYIGKINVYMSWVKEQLCIKLLVAEADCAASGYLSSVLFKQW